MRKVFIHHPIFRIVAPFFTGIIAYLLVLLNFDAVQQLTEVFFSKEAVLCIAIAYLQFEGMRFGIMLVQRKWEATTISYILGQIINALLISFAIASIVICFYFVYFVNYTSFTSFSSEFFVINSAFLVMSLGYSTLFVSVFYLNVQNKKRLTQEKANQQNVELQLEAFKNQVNSDFLYKSLESLISLIHHSPENAEDFIDQLAALYRYALDNQKEDLISVREELRSVQRLIELENFRFHQNIDFEIDMNEEELEKLVVPNTLHWLTEYLIEQTIITDTQPMTIRCHFESNDYVVLSTRLNLRLMPDQQIVTGLEKAQKTYLFYTDIPIVQVKVDGQLLLKIPPLFLEKPVHKSTSRNIYAL